jgi:hypothetical protein
MAKPISRSVFGSDAHQFTDTVYKTPPCAWRGCHHDRWNETPVCLAHALAIVGRVQDDLADFGPEGPPPKPLQGYVYYLMIGPSTVKIGTTTDLKSRLNQLRSDPQYVVAIEPGGRDVERQRHLQFATERIGRRENFRLSETSAPSPRR